MTSKFKNKVAAGDIIAARIMIANELMLDPRGYSFHEMLDYAASRLPNLFEIYDGKGGYTTDEASWNEDYLSQVKSDLNYNFSKERLDYYEKVAKSVLKEKAEELERSEPQVKTTTSSQHGERTTRDYSSRPSYSYGTNGEPSESDETGSPNPVHVGITVGSAAIAVAGLCLSRMALASLGVVGVVIGGCLIYNDLKK